MRRSLVVGLLVVVAGVAAFSVLAWATADQPTPTPPSVDGQDPAAALVTRPATVLQSVPFRREPAGPAIRDEFGENEELARVGQRVTILGEQVVPGSGQWVRVFVEVDPSAWPGDFYAWLPVASGGKPVLEPQDVVECPADLDLAGLAPLSPSDRLRCAGHDPITMDARVVFGSGYAAYNVEPAFFGGRESWDSVVGLADPGRAFGMYADTSGPWLDAAVAPGIPLPPVDVDVHLTGRFDHPAAPACRRTAEIPAFDPPPPAGAGLPPEAPADSGTWCRGRFVITAWTMTAGPERQPPVPGQVQLHRSLSGGECAGVGMDGPLTFRIDLAQPDPVWIERPGDTLRIVPRFSNRFSFVKEPEPGVSDGAGLVIRNGTEFDPEIGFPGGRTIDFE